MIIAGDENPYKSCQTLAAFLLTLAPSLQLQIGIFVSTMIFMALECSPISRKVPS